MSRTKAQEKMVMVSVYIPKQLLEELDELVAQGLFPSRSEAVRVAVAELLRSLRQGGVSSAGGDCPGGDDEDVTWRVMSVGERITRCAKELASQIGRSGIIDRQELINYLVERCGILSVTGRRRFMQELARELAKKGFELATTYKDFVVVRHAHNH